MPTHSASEDARKRADVAGIHIFRAVRTRRGWLGQVFRPETRPQRSTDRATAREQKFAGLFARISQVVIDGLTGLVGQLELDFPSRLPLPDHCAVDRVAVGRYVLNL